MQIIKGQNSKANKQIYSQAGVFQSLLRKAGMMQILWEHSKVNVHLLPHF